MTDVPAESHPTIEVQDFGPIIDGKIELRPLTVFAGPSNTGKSWFACLLYALAQHDADHLWRYGRRYDVSSGNSNQQAFPEDPSVWMDSIIGRSSISFSSREQAYLKSIVDDAETYVSEMLLYFGVSKPEHLVRENSDRRKAKITYESPAKARATFEIDRNGMSSNIDLPKTIVIPSTEQQPRKTRRSRMRDNLIACLNEIQHGPDEERDQFIVTRSLVRDLIDLTGVAGAFPFGLRSSAWYLPADRGGIMHAHRAVVSALVQSASRAALRPQTSIPPLSGVLADFLENLIQMSPAQNRVFMRRGLVGTKSAVAGLESKVLGGTINVDTNEANYPSFSWQPKDWDRSLPLVNVSSMVSELAPVALYLRYCVSPGDLLILEEPEAHLHPAKQVELINEIASWIRGGIRVVVTTHSEWVLDGLANLVAAGTKGKESGLGRHEVGLWHFKPREPFGGSQINEIRWDRDEGGYDTDFYDVATSLHNQWASLVDESDE